MTIADGVALLHDAITSGTLYVCTGFSTSPIGFDSQSNQTPNHTGILNDMGSGSNVDMCIIHSPTGAVEYRRDVRAPSPSSPPSASPTANAPDANDDDGGGGGDGSSSQRPPAPPSLPSSFLRPRGALAAAAGPRTARADIYRLVGGNVGRGEVRHEPLQPFRCVGGCGWCMRMNVVSCLRVCVRG